ncbi:MAG: FHA domain-containing protein [Gemmatimonadaceae bacterium]|jgi:hypothetical protein|nr:FHA domain-containing protein [Gemmatimonadaceae bacterium]
MTDEFFPYLLGFFGVLLVIALGAVLWVSRSPKSAREPHERIPLFTGAMVGEAMPAAPPPPPLGTASGVETPRVSDAPVARPTPVAPPPVVRPTPARPAAPVFIDVPQPPRRETPPVAPRAIPGPFVPRNGSPRPGTAAREFSTAAPTNGTPAAEHGVPGTLIDAHAVRYSIPAEGTLQFLPGRLEIASGLDQGREIRFVRLPGPEGTTVTFGRSEGPLYQHIQLRDQTVSRAHARMRLIDGAWHLTNLSTTNPVAVNGEVMGDGDELVLEEGDRIEMGEVAFAFRNR